MNLPFTPVFETATEWIGETDHKLVSGCSDGKYFSGRTELFSLLEIKRPDTIFWPGGAGAFVSSAPWSAALMDQAKLLHQKHQINHFIGFVHFECAYYLGMYREWSLEQIFSQQVKDLYLFRESMLKIQPKAKVDLFYEHPYNDHIGYTLIE